MIYINNINDFISKKKEYAEVCYKESLARFVPNRSADFENPWRPRTCIDPNTNTRQLDDDSAWGLIGDHLCNSNKSDWEVQQPVNKNIHTKYHAFWSILSNKKDNKKDIYMKIQVTENMTIIVQEEEVISPRVFGISFHITNIYRNIR